MRGILFIICITIAFTCYSQNMNDKSAEVSINKVWKFIKYDIVKRNYSKELSFRGDENVEYLDLSEKDTARFVSKDHNKPPERIPYKIADNIIFMASENNSLIGFKIWKLTANELILLITYPKTFKEPEDNAVTMLFESK